MNRKEIKSLAKSKIKGNLWNILWPMLIIGIITSILSNLLGGSNSVVNINIPQGTDVSSIDFETMMENVTVSPKFQAMNTLVTFISGIFTVAYIKYLINFVRNGKAEFNDIIETIKARWLQILLANILLTVIITAASLLLIVPGIIMAFAYAMVSYLIVDTDIESKDALTKSREMMKGYKWNYFVFLLSFIGWYLLPFGAMILLIALAALIDSVALLAISIIGGLVLMVVIYIWLIPYVNVSKVLYYEKLKEIRG